MGLPTISPAELQRRLGSVEVIDVNAPQSWTLERVPGARRLDPAGFNAADLPAVRAAGARGEVR
jgi:hypothetical protein